MRGQTATAGGEFYSRNFAISLAIIALLIVSSVFFAWTHASLNREDLALRLGRRSVHLQSQLELMLEKRKQVEEFHKLVEEKTGARIATQQHNEDATSSSLASSSLAVPSAGFDIKKISDVTGPSYATAKEISLRYHTRYWLERKDQWPK